MKCLGPGCTAEDSWASLYHLVLHRMVPELKMLLGCRPWKQCNRHCGGGQAQGLQSVLLLCMQSCAALQRVLLRQPGQRRSEKSGMIMQQLTW